MDSTTLKNVGGKDNKMTREELKGLGLTDEQIEKIMASHGKVITEVKEKADKVDGLESQIKDYKQEIKDRDKQLSDLEKKAEGDEDLEAEIKRLKKENDTTKTELQEKLDKQAFDFALDKALSSSKVKNTKATKALLDVEIIKLDGDKLLGLDSQLEAIKESDPYLFDEEKDPNSPNILAGGNPKGDLGINSNPFSKENWNLTEQSKLYAENPELYNSLKSQAGK